MNKTRSLAADRRRKTALSAVLAVVCVIYVLPVLTVVLNSFKLNTFVKTDTFALPSGEMWAGLENFIKGMTFGNYPFWKSAAYSVVITLLSTALILLCTSMAAWYIARVNSKACRALYFLCVFSMVVPFQMVMYTLSKTADQLKLNTPWTIPIVYLGFGAGLAIFMFVGFVKSIPLEIEEAAAIDGAGKWKQTLHVTIPGITPTIIVMLILRMGSLMSMGYEKTILLYNSAIYDTADIISSYVYRVGLIEQDWSYSTAIGLFNSVINCALLVITNMISKRTTENSLW